MGLKNSQADRLRRLASSVLLFVFCTLPKFAYGQDAIPPQWIAATGSAGDTVISFWFDEDVTDQSAITIGSYSLSGGLTVSSIELYGEWGNDAVYVPTTRSGVGVGVLNNEMYVVGGLVGLGPQIFKTTVESYDPNDGSWTSITSMPTARSDPLVVSLGGLLYVLGGSDAITMLSVMEVYNPASGTWSSSTMLEPHGAGTSIAAIIDSTIYVSRDETLMQVYDPVTTTWQYLFVGHGFSGVAHAVINGKWYMAGGTNKGISDAYYDTLVVFDPISETITPLTSMPTSRYAAVGGNIGGKFWVAGGSIPGRDTNVVEIYDPDTDTWTTAPSAPNNAGDGIGTVFNRQIYLSQGNEITGIHFDVYTRGNYQLTLGSGQILPSTSVPVILAASNISDLHGNTAASLDTTFNPTTGAVPSILLSNLSGIYSGDISIPFQISDTESNPVSLTAGYSSDGGLSWQFVTISGTTTNISYTSYQDTLIWQSQTDLAGQQFDQVWFKITPSDNATISGVADSISFGLDNKPPEWIAATGAAGDTTIKVWFDELVDESFATNTSNYTISNGLTIETILPSGSSGEWITSASLPISRDQAAYGVIDGKLYIAGGTEGGNTSATLIVYDPVTDSWTTKSSMPMARNRMAGAVINGKLYVVGGYNNAGDPLGLLEVYDPVTDSWTTKTPMPTARPWTVAGAINGKLYVAGGLGGPTGYYYRIEIYDPATDSWTTGQPSPLDRGYAAGGVIDGKLYIAGGDWPGDSETDTNFLEVYDPILNSWTNLSPMPTSRHSMTATVMNGKLFVIGGSHIEALSTVEVYNPTTDSWTVEASMPTPRSNAASGAIGGKIIVAGGLGGSGDVVESLIIQPDQFIVHLSSGQNLPSADSTVTVTATNIADLYGNTATSLDTTFNPSVGERPSITLSGLSGTQSGDLSIPFQISDLESNPVSLAAEYSVDGGSIWSVATISGTTTDIPSISYQDTLIWHSRTDLPGQAFSSVSLKVTPSDNATTAGVADSISFGLDNKPPEWIAASGVAGDTTITFWFDEPVEESTARDTSNISVFTSTETLIIDSIDYHPTWATGPSIPTLRKGPAYTVLEQKLYIIGGDSGSGFLSDLEVYDPLTDTWVSKTPPNQTFSGAIAEVINGRLYAFGGGLGLAVYNPVADSWQYPGGGVNVYKASSGIIGGKLYVAGGDNSSLVQEYDPSSDTWTSKASMPTGRGFAGFGVINGRLYVAGGFNNPGGVSNEFSALESYDPASDTWLTHAPIPIKLHSSSSVVLNGILYVIGGSSLGVSQTSIWIYNPVTDTWREDDSLPVKRTSGASGTIDGTIYITAGWHNDYMESLDIYNPLNHFSAHLGGDQVVPDAQTEVYISVVNISDILGNVISTTLDTSFFPTTSALPLITLSSIGGTQSGDISIPFQISDTENNPVSLTAGYSSDGGLSWQFVTISGTTTNISYTSYQDTLIWQSQTDLAGQQFDQVWFKITPSDNATISGVADSISFGLDNKPPEWIAATGSAGDTTITVWFDELVDESFATNTSNYTISDELTIETILPSGSSGEWITSASLPSTRNQTGYGVIDGKLYIAGGGGSGNYSATLIVYDPGTDSWTNKSSMPTARAMPASAVINGKLYVVGGTNGSPLGNLEVYDPVSDAWEVKSSMPTARPWPVAGAINGKLFVAGGEGGPTGYYYRIEIYDPATDSWTTGQPSPINRAYAAGGVIDGKFYIAGGDWPGDISNFFEVYDPVLNTWTNLSPMPTARACMTTAIMNGKLFVIGGQDINNEELNTIEVYDPATDSWTVEASMPSPHTKAASGAISGKIIVAGGEGSSGDVVESLIIQPDQFIIHLSNAQILPSADSTVTVTATNIVDLYGNTTASLDTTFNPSVGERPSITLSALSGTQSGDLSIPFQISDLENNPVSLAAEYSVDGGSSWSAATISGTTTDIPSTSYQDILIWHSRTDLPSQAFSSVSLKIIPKDNPTAYGTSHAISFGLDNKPPEWIAATGVAGDSTIEFWFDEVVDDVTSTNTTNYSISDGLSFKQISYEDSMLSGSSMPSSFSGLTADVYGGKLYVIGLFDSSVLSLYVYDPISDIWSIKSDGLHWKSDAPFAAIDGKLYVVGGQGPELDVYDIESNTWTTEGSGPNVYKAAFEVIGDIWYVVGGNNGVSVSSGLHIYDSTVKNWNTGAGMPTPRQSCTAGAIDDKIYVVGGEDGQSNAIDKLEVYDTNLGVWSTLSPIPESLYDLTSGVIDEKLYVVGGFGDQGKSDKIYVYDPLSDSWAIAGKISSPRTLAATGVINDKLYIAGGVSVAGASVDFLEIFNPKASYRGTLSNGQILPSAAIDVSISALNIKDTFGNQASMLVTTFKPTTGEAPDISLTSFSGTQSSDISIPFQISDTENNSVTLMAGYSSDGGLSWQSATITGTTTDIPSTSYQDTLTWQSRTDLPGQAFDQIWFKVTPSDNATTSGTPDSISFGLDNKPPEWIAGSGDAGDSTFTFWFDEQVPEDLNNFASTLSLSQNMVIDTVEVTTTWSTGTSLPGARQNSAPVVVSGTLYLFGGTADVNRTNNLSELLRYDPVTEAWTQLTPCSYARHGAAIATIDNKIYIIGGMEGGTRSSGFTPAIYDIQSDIWQYPDNGPGVAYASAVVIGDRIYVAFGDNNTGGILHIYDPSTEQWTQGAPMPTARETAASAVYNGLFYVAGGHLPDGPIFDVLEVYDPLTDSWNTLSPLPAPLRYSTAVAYRSKIYLFGGETSSSGSTDQIYIYDINTDTWTVEGPMPSDRSGASAGLIHGQVYIASGISHVGYSDGNTGTTDLLEIYTPNAGWRATLASGYTLPSAQTSVSLSAINVTDAYGNAVASLDTTFYPSTGSVPAAYLSQFGGTQSGDVSVPFQISDAENNPVTLTAGFSSDGGLSWQSATITGTTTNIPYTSYQDTLIWQSRTDIPGQAFDQIWLKVTPSDNATTSGVPDSISFGLDNKPPEWIAASGVAGDTSISFWFDEAISDEINDFRTNLALSQGMTIDTVTVTTTWSAGSPLPSARENASVIVVSGKLYLFGGASPYPNTINELIRYDPITQSWTQLEPCTYARHGAAIGAIDNKIYIIGGMFEGTSSSGSRMAIYDISSNAWEYPDSGHGTTYAAAGVINRKLYVAGGGGYGGELHVYDPATALWTQGTSMPTARDYAASAVFNGRLYVAGGKYSEGPHLDVFEVYDPRTDTWETLSPLPTPLTTSTAVAYRSKIYLFGGYTPTEFASNIVYIYDIPTDTWIEEELMPIDRQGAMACLIKGQAFITGGNSNTAGSLDRLDIYTPDAGFNAILSAGQTLPSSQVQVLLSASNVTDQYGNIAVNLDTTFSPTTGEVPSVSISRITGTKSGDISVPFIITDPENNPVSLTAGYSSDGGLSWHSAMITGTTTDILSTSYQDTLIWQSRTDLPRQAFDQVWFKVTPSDNATTSGVPDSVSFGLDNKPPEWIAATGAAGDTTITFWFDELVEESIATDTAKYSISGSLSIESVRIADGGNGSWSTIPPIPTPSEQPAVGIINGKLYVAGGGYNGPFNILEIFDIYQGTWTTETPMPTGRYSAAYGVIGGKLYVAGGQNSQGTDVSVLEVYDPLTNSWTTKASMPYPKDESAFGVIDGRLFVAGGSGGNGRDLLVYDPTLDLWETKANMLKSIAGGAAGVIRGKLYMTGGYDDQATALQIYDPTTDSWSYGTSMFTKRWNPSAAVVLGSLYVIGGEWYPGGDYISTVEVYAPTTDSWTTIDPISIGRYRASSTAAKGTLYVIGGTGKPAGSDELVSAVETYTVLPDKFIINLGSGQTLPYELITLQATGIQDLLGNEAGTLTVDFVPNDENDNPTISLDAISSEVAGDLSISYTISDTEGDLCDLSPAYSIDGGSTWFAVTTGSDTIDIDSGSYTGTLIWQSFTDLPNFELEDVRFRISVIDNDIEIGVSDEIAFHLDNNEVPTITITDAVYTVSDTTWTFSFSLSDAESDALSIVNEYSTDDGGTWLDATVLGSFSDILSSAYSDSLTWKAGEDLPDATQEVLFRITPGDLDEGISAERTVFVNSLGVPTLKITSDLSAEQTADITVEYTADDINSDTINLVFEYEYPTDTWNTATVTGSSTLAGPSEYTGSVIWHSGTDMLGLDVNDVQFRITPNDTHNPGFAAQVLLHVDNNSPPSLSLTSPTGHHARDILIDCQLSDSESDNLSVQTMWSADKGTTWQPMTLDGDYSNLPSGQYSQTVVWKSFDDCGYGLLDSVQVKFTPSDNDPGSEVISGYFKVKNYVSDFSGDMQINFSDFATLVTAWNEQNTYHDIGPAAGSVPDLIPESDGAIDFEDLTVYLQMWTWSAANLASSNEQQISLSRPVTSGVSQLSVIEIERKHPVILKQPLPEDVWASDDGVMKLELEAVEVTGVSSAGVVLHYDTEHLRFLDVQPGTFLGRAGASDPGLIFIKQVDEQTGRIELMLGRISPNSPATGGSGILATLQFIKLSKENSTVRVSYDLRNKTAELITSDTYQTTVEATLIPKDFALLQNYPNPFNSETVIRFQLPSEQRVRLYVFNVRGQRVATLLDEKMDPGYHKITWDGRNDDNRQVASGIYIYLIQAGQHRQSKKMTILREGY